MTDIPMNHEPIPFQVEARMASARTGFIMSQMGQSLFGADIFTSAPLRSPPIATGMVDTLTKLENAIMHIPSPLSMWKERIVQVSTLLRRLRHLLRVYYDVKLSKRKPDEFKYCDQQDIADLGLKLHEMGMMMQLMPPRLRALFEVDGMEAFVLDEPLDAGKWRLDAQRLNDKVKADPESDADDRMAATEAEDSSGKDLAAYYMSYLVADLIVGLIGLHPANDRERARQEKAMAKLVEYSTSPFWRRTLGDNLTDAMRPIYWSDKLTLWFAHEGGLPALFDDWAQSMASKYCDEVVKKLPSEAWERQTGESLQGVFAGLIHKREVDGSSVAETYVFAKIMHEMYSRYGLAPFEKASTMFSNDIIFYFLYRRISRKPDAYTSASAMLGLLKKFKNVPKATKRRHGWMIMSISDRWECIKLYGCINENCPEREALLELRNRRVRGVRDPVVEDRLFQWGGASKACANCRHVSYCSTTCQKVDWKAHKTDCKARTPTDPSQVEKDI